MYKTTVKVGGMACGMCESHVNDAVRRAFKVEKVKSSHSKGQTVIVSEEPLDQAALRAAIDATGYDCGDIESEEVRKRGLFGF
jgi:copper chaperone CopZ